MKKKKLNEGKIYFQGFVFNPLLRTLQKDDAIIRLRNKQAGVLELLCTKYPEPVLQEEFLSEVWHGRYVTSQSIAQTIRSLRIYLGDESKSIIVTIPKLGYQLASEPVWEALPKEQETEAVQTPAPAPEPEQGVAAAKVDSGVFLAEHQEMHHTRALTMTPITTMTPCFSPGAALLRRGGALRMRTWVYSALVAIFFSLIFFAMNARGYPLGAIEEEGDFSLKPFSDVIPKNSMGFLYCCQAEEGFICSYKRFLSLGKCNKEPY